VAGGGPLYLINHDHDILYSAPLQADAVQPDHVRALIWSVLQLVEPDAACMATAHHDINFYK